MSRERNAMGYRHIVDGQSCIDKGFRASRLCFEIYM